MLPGIIAAVLLIGLASGPLLWRIRQDRRQARADAVRADANAALWHTFGGESFVAVQVEAPSLWRAGRVVLSAPSDWQSLLAPAWKSVAPEVPDDYEMVVKPVAAPALLTPDEVELHRAA